MQKTTAGLAGLLALGALLPSAFAHSDTGQHAFGLQANDAVHFDTFDPECDGGGEPCYFGGNDVGFDNWPGVSAGPSGWYTGSVSAWAEAQAGPDVTVVPAGTLPPPLDGGIAITPGFLFAAAFGLCDAEILSDGSAAGAAEDESVVNGVPGGGAPDGTFNDGGIGAVCHTPDTFYAYPPYNTPGCSLPNAAALDGVVAEDIWLSTSCDWLTSAVESGMLDHYLSLTTCAVNTALTGDVPGGAVACVNTFVACAVTGVGCPGPGASFCGADGVGDAGESGQGDGGNDGGIDPVNGVPYPAGPFGDSEGNVCAGPSAAVFVWNSVVADVASDANDPSFESISLATSGWISASGQDVFRACGSLGTDADAFCGAPPAATPFCHVWTRDGVCLN